MNRTQVALTSFLGLLLAGEGGLFDSKFRIGLGLLICYVYAWVWWSYPTMMEWRRKNK